MTKNAKITPILAAGSIDSPYFAQLYISQELCHKVCKDNVPVFAPAVTYVSISEVDTGQYVATFHVEGVISYLPCGRCCTTQTMNVSQNFTLPIASATAPTSVTVTAGPVVNALIAPSCKNCTDDFSSQIPLTITVS